VQREELAKRYAADPGLPRARRSRFCSASLRAALRPGHGEQDGDKISLTTLNYAIDFGSHCCYITHIPAHRGASSRDDPEGGAGSGVLRLRLVTVGPGRSGTPPGALKLQQF
jgi:hypothetical protein